ncbi:unnamed protein product [Eruca vesicaria subsp. sativa]|uniref:protein disulfide-isomerase n=1 Tax=Eruca vesicaria subsp. sativa TaxID=29727 RepID=A0ABC8KFY2_ERUVS|nr:unnamed protein product [Eruca vesicaria subsp. sativa]
MTLKVPKLALTNRLKDYTTLKHVNRKKEVIILEELNNDDELSDIDHDVVSVEDARDSITEKLHCITLSNQKSKPIDYEKAVAELSRHVLPVVPEKIDASEETNKEYATQFEVQGFPIIKIFRNGCKAVQDNGPREADEVVGDKKVKVFPNLSRSEFVSFLATAEKLRSDYDFAHTSDAKLLPCGESSIPLFTVFDKNSNNHPYVIKFFDIPNTKWDCKRFSVSL